MHCWWECKYINSHYGEQYGVSLKKKKSKLGIELPYDPEIPPLDVFPEKTVVVRHTCTPVFVAALFFFLTIPRGCKQPRCPVTNEWMQKSWYMHTVEFYSAIKKNAFESVLTTWMNLEPLVQNAVSQKEKDRIAC